MDEDIIQGFTCRVCGNATAKDEAFAKEGKECTCITCSMEDCGDDCTPKKEDGLEGLKVNKEKLLELKNAMEVEENIANEIKVKRDEFELVNAELFSRQTHIYGVISDCKEVLKENAEVGYGEDGIKKRIGGIGIRISKTIDYDKKDALVWAQTNMPVAVETVLNKKLFEKFAKENELDFVKLDEKVSVTFPKEIVVE